MTSAEVRRSFLDFFKSKGHTIVPSSPVVLPADPTLLFANAGMNQFKEIFLGARAGEYRRVADTQKCIRVSGKHNDLEEVGRDTYHHTFFEMLGNWSFGDYYKREAIAWAWELLTGVWKLPKDRLWATVYREDDEAERLWREVTDIAPDHILRFGEKENFWEMGETGPCGPCSEIHMDLSESRNGAKLVNAGSPECIELWNLVFMQYNRRADGSLEELPAKHVDTGMGFERVCAVLQGKKSNYDSDVFQPLLAALREMTGRPYEGEEAVAMRVIGDHLRALSFAVADGVLPSNEGRGYVLRRLLRRAVRFGRKLGLTEPFLGRLFPVLETQLGGVFPELTARRADILRALAAEERSFAETLDRGLALFDEVAADARRRGAAAFPGAQAFKLYDTYGFPMDLTRLMAREAGLTLDEAEFEKLMTAQRDRARQARRNARDDRADDLTATLVQRGLSCRFTGYDTLEQATVIRALVRDGALVEELRAGETGLALPAETPCYGEAGGQLGDTGRIESGGAAAAVTDTQKPAEGLLLHHVRVERGVLRVGDAARVTADAARRRSLAAHHTATHLLNAALRETVGPTVQQAGSQVAPDGLRFDFNWFEALTTEQLARIETRVNEHVRANAPVRTSQMALKDVPGSGIVAVFDEKYGETVRVVEAVGISRELCGGTHAAATGEIGLFRLVAESSVAAGIRRIEAKVGAAAVEWTQEEHALVSDLCRRFSAAPAELPQRIEALNERIVRLERELKARQQQDAARAADALAATAQPVGGAPVLAAEVGETDAEGLRALGDRLREKCPDAALLLGARTADGKALFLLALTPALTARGLHAGKLIGPIAKAAGGGGGGQPLKAQAGGRDGARVAAALEVGRSALAQALGA